MIKFAISYVLLLIYPNFPYLSHNYYLLKVKKAKIREYYLREKFIYFSKSNISKDREIFATQSEKLTNVKIKRAYV